MCDVRNVLHRYLLVWMYTHESYFYLRRIINDDTYAAIKRTAAQDNAFIYLPNKYIISKYHAIATPYADITKI